MKGPHDDKLEQSGHWPLRGTFTIELLNQLNDSDHYSHMVQFHHYHCSKCTNRVLVKDIADRGLGSPQFISHDTLFNHSNYGYHKGDSLIFRISYEGAKEPHKVAPVTFKLTKFSLWWKSNQSWYSSSFFAFSEEYQMCLRVDAAGNGDGEGTHVSVFLYLMKGPHDDKLEQSGHWPMGGIFTIELLNQLNDSDHYTRMVQFHHYHCSKCTNRVLVKDIAGRGSGSPQFISHDTLFNHSNYGYHKDDSVIFTVSYESVEKPHQIAPVTFKVTKFSLWLKSKQVWHSSSFFAFSEGYQMCLVVDAAGYGKGGEGAHLSVYLRLLKGPHDDKLEQSGHWPLRGTFTMELLDQLNDSDHYIRMAQFHHYLCSECTNRVLVEGKANSPWVSSQFISHDSLFNHSNGSYHKGDSLIFRVSYESVEESHKVAPVTFKLTKFSLWLKSKQIWHSSSFFAFSEGYRMCLVVDAAGYGKGEGAHLSVYLRLLKGPHDDKLEKLGHWPLRGTFKIELLNQLRGSYTYWQKIHFTTNTTPSAVNRVTEGDMATEWGYSLFVLHDALFDSNNGYLKNGNLYFRISYQHDRNL